MARAPFEVCGCRTGSESWLPIDSGRASADTVRSATDLVLKLSQAQGGRSIAQLDLIRGRGEVVEDQVQVGW